MPLILFLSLLALVSGCASNDASRNLIDAGHYKLDLTEFGSWTVRTDKAQDFVVLERKEEHTFDTVRGAHFCTLRVTLPENLRAKPHVEIARDFCAAQDSFVQKNLFPAPIRQNWSQTDNTTIGDRVVITFGGEDLLNSRPGERLPPHPILVRQRAVVYVWFPPTFEQDGGLYLVSGFETVTIPPAYSSDLPVAKSLLAAVRPH